MTIVHQSRPSKSLCLAYFFLLIGGFFGLHQLYLGRYRHAFALWISFGGYFGLGLLRELWKMSDYLSEVNGDEKFVSKLVNQMQKQSKPSFGISRYFGSVIVADILGYLAMGAIPHEWFCDSGNSDNPISRLLISLLVPCACALGVHIVGNIGRYSGSIKWPLIAAFLTSPFYWFNINAVFLTSLIAVLAFVRYSLEWNRTPIGIYQQNNHKLVLVICVIIYLSLWASWFYFNCTVTDKNDETIKCRQAVRNFFNSPAWQEFRKVIQDLWQFLKTQGIQGLWKEIVEALDPQGEKNALKILGLNDTASQDEITSNYRKLARQWHPDKHHNTNDQKEAQEKFIMIQEAYDLLSKMKQKRLKKQLD